MRPYTKLSIIFLLCFFLGSPAFGADCDCSKTTGTCVASARFDSQWIYLTTSTQSCADIRFYIKTNLTGTSSYPQQSTISGGSLQQAWTGQGRITDISVNSCNVCSSDTSRPKPTSSASAVYTCSQARAEIIKAIKSTTAGEPEWQERTLSSVDQSVEDLRRTGACQ